MAHKSGFVNIIGNPNVGKSTLMNNLVGEKISIITSKAQTTRHRIMGIVSGEDFQIVYSDTPGILKPNYKLQESMMNFVHSAFIDADIILYVVEVGEMPEKNQETVQKIIETGLPVILIINKVDTSDQQKVALIIEAWEKEMPKARVVPVSALHKFNLDTVFNLILKELPESPAFYPKEVLTDKSERFIVSEIIREKILQQYKKEIPYSVEVVVEAFKEREDIIHIEAILFVARESQKGIIIGHKGVKIKHVGIDARKDIEHFFKKKVYLELFVKVAQDWRNKDQDLRRFGYQH